MSKTENALKEAFAGESQGMSYLWFHGGKRSAGKLSRLRRQGQDVQEG